MGQRRQALRKPPAVYRKCSVGLLSFSDLEMSDHVVRIVDLSSRGVCVESDEQMEPGLVWFHTGVGDRRGGILLWSRKQDGGYRAGIRFLSLTDEDERLLRYWPPCSGKLRPCSDLEEFITAWMKAGRARGLPGSELILSEWER